MIKFYFKTYGCQANVADSEGLMKYLGDLGCSSAKSEDEADVIFVNSCAVREKAEQKMFSYLGALKPYKDQKPYMRIGVIGCVASYKKKEMYERFDHINFVFGAREKMGTFQAYLLDMITALETTKQLYLDSPGGFKAVGQDRDVGKVVEDKKLQVRKFAPAKMIAKKKPKEVKKAFVNITTGCNNYCTFCIVPFTRGRETSYSMSDIVDRVKREVLEGAREITLIGQNVNSYVDPDTGATFSKLLEEVAKVDGEFWVRYISPHPKDMTEDVLDVMAKYSDKLCDWVHMPLQSGSNEILKTMNRTYSVDRYMEVIGWVRDRLPNATITTDIIVGFPGESDEDYQGTRDVMERVKYDLIYSFIYSKRKYTKAYKMEDDTPQEVKSERLKALQARNQEICLERNLRYIGRIVRTLVEKRLSNGKLLARTSGNVRVTFDGDDSLVGGFVDLKIKDAGPVNLEGSLI